MFEVVLLVALGPRLVWPLLAPLLFLFFLVPSGAFLVPSLQKITAEISVAGLHALSYSGLLRRFHDRDTGRQVRGCRGLRRLALSDRLHRVRVLFRCRDVSQLYPADRLYCIVRYVPIAANGMRALGIIVLAHLEGSAAAVEADHIL